MPSSVISPRKIQADDPKSKQLVIMADKPTAVECRKRTRPTKGIPPFLRSIFDKGNLANVVKNACSLPPVLNNISSLNFRSAIRCSSSPSFLAVAGGPNRLVRPLSDRSLKKGGRREGGRGREEFEAGIN